MDQQLDIVLREDLAAFETILSQLMSSANEMQLQAEALFNLCRERHPDALVLKLAQVLLSSQTLEIRAMATVLLRKQVTSSSGGDSDESWSRLTPDTKSSIKSLLLSAVQREETKCIAKKLCHTVSEIASILLPSNSWPELLPFMFQAANSDSPRLQESALLISSQLGQYIVLFPHLLPTLRSVFLNSLSHSSSLDVRIAASVHPSILSCVSLPIVSCSRASFQL